MSDDYADPVSQTTMSDYESVIDLRACGVLLLERPASWDTSGLLAPEIVVHWEAVR